MTTAEKRTYLVLDKGSNPPVGRLVKTISTQRAVAHVVGERYDVRVATQDDLIYALTAGVKVEEIGEQSQAPNPGRRASDKNGNGNAASGVGAPVSTGNDAANAGGATLAPNLVSVAA
jgi:hypothetical protein